MSKPGRLLPGCLLALLIGISGMNAEAGDQEEPAMDFFKGEPDAGYPSSSPLSRQGPL